MKPIRRVARLLLWVCLTRFELATSTFVALHSIHLSYRHIRARLFQSPEPRGNRSRPACTQGASCGTAGVEPCTLIFQTSAFTWIASVPCFSSILPLNQTLVKYVGHITFQLPLDLRRVGLLQLEMYTNRNKLGELS